MCPHGPLFHNGCQDIRHVFIPALRPLTVVNTVPVAPVRLPPIRQNLGAVDERHRRKQCRQQTMGDLIPPSFPPGRIGLAVREAAWDDFPRSFEMLWQGIHPEYVFWQAISVLKDDLCQQKKTMCIIHWFKVQLRAFHPRLLPAQPPLSSGGSKA